MLFVLDSVGLMIGEVEVVDENKIIEVMGFLSVVTLTMFTVS